MRVARGFSPLSSLKWLSYNIYIDTNLSRGSAVFWSILMWLNIYIDSIVYLYYIYKRNKTGKEKIRKKKQSQSSIYIILYVDERGKGSDLI